MLGLMSPIPFEAEIAGAGLSEYRSQTTVTCTLLSTCSGRAHSGLGTSLLSHSPCLEVLLYLYSEPAVPGTWQNLGLILVLVSDT